MSGNHDPQSDRGPSRPAQDPPEYVVVARRYRPRQFADLVGQTFVAKALSAAIATNRVGHAYLFTGARGVGKTSAARIFAKSLNCQRGMTATPCDACDICESVHRGDDVDVLEIDGASNRGIDEIRRLRENVHVRPARARFKVYIIDEVHMLTREAFNALLKTLEEPPEHVKFIFCTTEAGKIPITILSRCQRFDFAGIETASIAQRLRQIVAAEGVDAEAGVLEFLARRAGGSMRDSQSLLEQVIAFGGDRITLGEVNQLLGTAEDGRVSELVERIVGGDARATLQVLDQVLSEGVDVSQLLDQLFGYFRDLMVVAAGCGSDAMLHSDAAQRERLERIARRWDVPKFLAAMQILEQALARMRLSIHPRTLSELALVRICLLDQLTAISQLADVLRASMAGTIRPAAAGPMEQYGEPRRNQSARDATLNHEAISNRPAISQSQPAAAPGDSKKNATAHDVPLPADPSPCNGAAANALCEKAAAPQGPILDDESAAACWKAALGRVSGLLAIHAARSTRQECTGPDSVAVYFSASNAFDKSTCERPEQLSQLRNAMTEVTHRPIAIELRLDTTAGEEREPRSKTAPRRSPRQRQSERSTHPMVARARELFDAHIARYHDVPQR